MHSKAADVIARCRQLAQITDVPGETTRLFLSEATRDAHKLLSQWMQAAGLTVRTDDAGNLRGLRNGTLSTALTLLLFSHIDTVPHAGPFDGCLGVLLSLAVLELLRNKSLPFSVELIAFSEEEGVRFAWPFRGSRAVVGDISASDLERRDQGGETIASALRGFGLDPSRIARTCPLSRNTFAALEVHIEQGPVLDHEDLPIGVVDAIIGQTHLEFSFEGKPNHAGTTPMKLRRDALVAAAEWITEVERYASNHKTLVATVGSINVLPNATNVIPGVVRLTLDIRHRDSRTRHRAINALSQAALASGMRRGVLIHSAVVSEHPSVSMDPKITQQLLEASSLVGPPAPILQSGAGHDAMILAPHVPTALLFVRSPCGLSHHPDETVREPDVEAALRTVLTFIEHLPQMSSKPAEYSLPKHHDLNHKGNLNAQAIKPL
jgi:allantoate deiminase